ncbi:MAG: hypothetical protein P8P48_06355 [Saprospiraceae bacterium]|nr:hypothetical protein [Saprospiraceae bacterium]
MKKIILLFVLACTLFSCEQASEKTENQVGYVESSDTKSAAMDAFNDAYLSNDFSGQNEIFTENAVAYANGVEVSPAEMMQSFLDGRNFYDDIKNLDRTTVTVHYDDGKIYTNSWFKWEGVSKSSGKLVDSPVHSYFMWEGDKVAKVGFIFDSHDYVTNMGVVEETESPSED